MDCSLVYAKLKKNDNIKLLIRKRHKSNSVPKSINTYFLHILIKWKIIIVSLILFHLSWLEFSQHFSKYHLRFFCNHSSCTSACKTSFLFVFLTDQAFLFSRSCWTNLEVLRCQHFFLVYRENIENADPEGKYCLEYISLLTIFTNLYIPLPSSVPSAQVGVDI